MHVAFPDNCSLAYMFRYAKWHLIITALLCIFISVMTFRQSPWPSILSHQICLTWHKRQLWKCIWNVFEQNTVSHLKRIKSFAVLCVNASMMSLSDDIAPGPIYHSLCEGQPMRLYSKTITRDCTNDTQTIHKDPINHHQNDAKQNLQQWNTLIKIKSIEAIPAVGGVEFIVALAREEGLSLLWYSHVRE